jgi:hypothetical protein
MQCYCIVNLLICRMRNLLNYAIKYWMLIDAIILKSPEIIYK